MGAKRERNELTGLDFPHLDTCSDGYQYLLVLSDHFSNFVQVYPTTSKSAKATADRLYNDFMLRYGLSIRRTILRDQGRQFEKNQFSQLPKCCGFKQLRKTPCHPQINGQTERMKQAILAMFKVLPKLHKTQWKTHANKLVHAYECTKRSSTGYFISYLIFGGIPLLPIDLIFPTCHNTNLSQSRTSYVETMLKMKEAYQLSFQHSNKRRTKDVIKRITRQPCLTALEC